MTPETVKHFQTLGFSYEYPGYLIMRLPSGIDIVIGDVDGPLVVQVQTDDGAYTVESHDATNRDHAASLVEGIKRRVIPVD